MRAPRHKPQHFFKFIRPGNRNKVLIPRSFVKKMGWKKKKGSCNRALLRRGSREWPVMITGNWGFGDGWEKFVEENGIEECDFVLFRHEGNMVFEIMVFNSSTYERGYPPPPPPPPPPSPPAAGEETFSESFSESFLESFSGSEADPIPHTYMSKKPIKGEDDNVTSEDESISTEVDRSRLFKVGMTPYNIRMAELYVPLNFAKANGLRERDYKVFIRDDKKRLWKAGLKQKTTGVALRGWRKFLVANRIKVGDFFEVELIFNEEKPILNFHYLRRKLIKAHDKAKITMYSNKDRHPCFISTLKAYNFNKSLLYLPQKFVNANGLRDGKMILRNDCQESWTVELRDIGKYVYVARGWSDFRDANDLREGDLFKFELIQKGKYPIANFYCFHARKKKPVTTKGRSKVEARVPVVNDHPYFIAMMKTPLVQYIPIEFVRANGITNGELLLTYGSGERTWRVNVYTWSSNGYVYMGGGWKQFVIANHLKKGEEVKFELVENEERRIMNVSRIDHGGNKM